LLLACYSRYSGHCTILRQFEPMFSCRQFILCLNLCSTAFHRCSLFFSFAAAWLLAASD
jgi:hypothetical protein